MIGTHGALHCRWELNFSYRCIPKYLPFIQSPMKAAVYTRGCPMLGDVSAPVLTPVSSSVLEGH